MFDKKLYERDPRDYAMPWHFVTSCVSATGEDIDAMNRAATPVTYRTMLKHVGEAFINMQAQLGYDTRNKRETGLYMKRDWHVGYFKSTYRGTPCYFFRWSHIEHIFQEVSEHYNNEAIERAKSARENE